MIRFSEIISFAGSAFFLLTGLGLLGYLAQLILQGDRPALWFWLMCLSLGLLSFSFGAGILALALRTRRMRRAEEEPEADRASGRPCVIVATPGKHLLLLGFIVWVWNLFGVFLIAMLLSRPASTFGERAMVAGWLLAGFALFLVFACEFLSIRKSGRSEFHTGCPAGRVGGVLEGRIVTRAELDRATALRVRLVCMAQLSFPVPPVDGAAPAHPTKNLWQTEQLIGDGHLTRNGRMMVLPVRFEIPANCLPTGALDGWHPVFWQLVAEAELPGIDYFAAFDLPVAGSE